MYKNYLGELIARIIENHFHVTIHRGNLNESKNLIYFEFAGVDNKYTSHIYKGYLGSVGNVCVNEIDGKDLGESIRLTYF